MKDHLDKRLIELNLAVSQNQGRLPVPPKWPFLHSPLSSSRFKVDGTFGSRDFLSHWT